MLSALLADMRMAIRSARRQPAFAAVVVGTLALGIGANTAMFAIIHAALLKPLSYQDPDRLILAFRTVEGETMTWNSAPDYYDYQEQAAGIESLAAIGSGAFKVTVRGAERPERVAASIVSSNLFRTLGVTPVAGRWFTEAEGRAGAGYTAVISEHYALRRFGGPQAAVGGTLAVSGVARTDVAATIVGVMPSSYRLMFDCDVWLPMRRGEGDGPQTRQFHNWILIGRLKPGVSREEAQSQVNVIAARLQQQYPASNKNKNLRLDPLQSALFRNQAPRLAVLMGAVALVLLIACANVAGLLLARGVARRPELAVRAALGASRGRIAAQLLTESLLLALVSGAVGVALAVGLQRLLPIATGLAESGVAARGLQWPVLLFALGASVLTGVLFGVAPALRASSLRLAEHLAPGARATDSKGGTRLRSVMVVGQVAISLVLLVGSGLLIRSLAQLMTVDLGFDAKGLVIGEVEAPHAEAERRIQFYEGLREDLAAIPGVSAVAFTSHVPIRHPYGDPPMWSADHPPVDSSQERTADFRIVLPGYFKALGIPFLTGRDLARTDQQDSPRVLVISENMASTLFPGEDPIGKRVMVATGTTPQAFEVVGVAGNVRLDGIAQPASMAMYASFAQFAPQRLRFMLRTAASPSAVAGAVLEAMAARDPNIAMEPLASMDQFVGDALLSDRVTAVTLMLFSGVALLLAAIGLYGVLAYYVTQRTHEIGVRLALGAGTRDVLGHVLLRSAMMVGPGLALGLAVALAGGRIVERFLYNVAPTDPTTFVTVTVALALVAFAASAWPALRAARINPITALRGE